SGRSLAAGVGAESADHGLSPATPESQRPTIAYFSPCNGRRVAAATGGQKTWSEPCAGVPGSPKGGKVAEGGGARLEAGNGIARRSQVRWTQQFLIIPSSDR